MFKLLKELDLLDWPTMHVGFQRGWVTKRNISEYATYLIEQNQDETYEFLLLLGCADFSDEDEIKRLMLKIIGNFYSEEFVLDKWRFAALSLLDKSRISEEEKLGQLQIIYANFNYPEDMHSCGIYNQADADPIAVMQEVILKLQKAVQQKN